eukprot:638322_1
MGNTTNKEKHRKCSCRRSHCCLQECFPPLTKEDNGDYQRMTKMEGIHDEDYQEGWQFTERHKTECREAIRTYTYLQLYISGDILNEIYAFLNVYVDGYYVHGHGQINDLIESTGKLCAPWWNSKLRAKTLPADAEDKGKGKPINIRLFGSKRSGKSSLVMRFWGCSDQELAECSLDPVIDYEYDKDFVLQPIGESITLHICEVAGSESQFPTDQMRTHMYIRKTHIALLCFAIDRVNALEPCIKLYQLLLDVWFWEREKNKHFNDRAILLVACKMDLMYDAESETMRDNYEKALKMSSMLNMPLIETSATKKINVYALIRQSIFEYWLQTETQSLAVMDNLKYNNL